jgi:uncharacterized protein YfaS (alpha-2-macroglobulin family)
LVSTAENRPEWTCQYKTGNGSWRYIFRIPGDTLRIDNDDYVYNNNTRARETDEKFEQQNSRVFFFLDRSIYRPGQAVYYKGIAITRDQTTGLSKIVGLKQGDWLYLKDVNSKTVDSAKFELNEYGSFHGKFQLPQNVLTGNFRLETKGLNRSATYFSVEEYKRPTFSASIQKPKGSYRLNDTITLPAMPKRIPAIRLIMPNWYMK